MTIVNRKASTPATATTRRPPAGRSPTRKVPEPANGSRDAPDARYVEKDLQMRILDLVGKQQTDRAARLLIDSLPMIHASNVNIKEKMNNLLFLAKAIQDGGGSKYGHTKLRSKVKTLQGFVRDRPLPAGGFLELGCGAHDPISLPVYFYLNGIAPAIGVDLLPPRTDYFSAISMYEILVNMKMFPGRYTWAGRKPFEIMTALRQVDTASFERGDFWGGLERLDGNVRLINEDLLICSIAPASIALLTSFAVLEHVGDIDAILRRTYELLAPGGIAYHFNDLADHRSYRGDGVYGPLSFLTEEAAPANMNRLRAPQMTAAARAVGFEILEDRRIGSEMSAQTQASLVAPFATMASTDVAVIKQHLVLRKPD
jgi:hypothetical protein